MKIDLVQELKEIKQLVQSGIDACVADSKEDDMVGKELAYVLGKVRGLRIINRRIDRTLNEINRELKKVGLWGKRAKSDTGSVR